MATKELQAIIEAYEDAQKRERACALVTVVKTEGSTYRLPGARMLVLKEGRTAGLGLISGGCLEDDARERALQVIATGKAEMVRYDTTTESDIIFGSGLGCQGVVHVLIEPLPAGRKARYAALQAVAPAFAERVPCVLASVISVPPPRRGSQGEPRVGDSLGMIGVVERRYATNIPDAGLVRVVSDDAFTALARRQTGCRLYVDEEDRAIEVFFDVIEPPLALLICGAGDDARPLQQLAREMGWRVRVVDPRPAYATRERFPFADEVIVCPADQIAERVPVEVAEAVMLMTHNFNHDRAILRAVSKRTGGYIGVLGPARRTERLLAEVGIGSEQGVQRVHGPAGLDIGAVAPEQIALSIVAEIEAVYAGRKGGFLKRRQAPLHATRRLPAAARPLS